MREISYSVLDICTQLLYQIAWLTPLSTEDAPPLYYFL
jgi:hypothetical protein